MPKGILIDPELAYLIKRAVVAYADHRSSIEGLPKALRDYRARHNIPLRTMAAQMKISYTQLSDLERGRAAITGAMLYAMAKLLPEGILP